MPIEGPWAEWAEKYFIHEETVESNRRSALEGWKPSWTLPRIEARRQLILQFLVAPGVVPYDGLIKERIVPVAHLKEGVPITVYKPTDIPETPLIVIFFHGGGLLSGNRIAFDAGVKQLAMTLQAVVASVEYRLLPCDDDPLAPLNDGVAVTDWIIKNKEALGGRRNSKIVLVGDSAGGQIASSVTFSIKSGIDFQVMVYPVIDINLDTESCKEFYTLPGFNTKSMEKIIERAGIGNESMASNPRVIPMVRNDLHTCPPTLIIVAPLDPLRDSAIQFADKLRAAGVDVELVIVDGVPHGFFIDIGNYPTKSKEGHNHLKRFLETRM